jgi:hypothetical protein
MYAALHPVPKIHAILVRGFTYCEAMRVPVVSFISAVKVTGSFYASERGVGWCGCGRVDT